MTVIHMSIRVTAFRDTRSSAAKVVYVINILLMRQNSYLEMLFASMKLKRKGVKDRQIFTTAV